MHTAPLAPLPLSFGELLIDPFSPRIAQFLQAPAANGTALMVIPVPNNPALNGVTIYTQAFAWRPGELGLCNAVDLVLGN